MKKRTAIKTDLFADEHHRKKIDTLGDPLAQIESYIDFAALAAEVDRVAPRPVSPQGGRPPYPTETMVRILVLKRLYNLSDEQMEYQLLDRMSYKRFCGLASAVNIPDRTTVWTFENRIGDAGAKVLFDVSRPNCSGTDSSPAAAKSSMPRWCLLPSNVTAVRRTSWSGKARCRLTGSQPNGARRIRMPPGRRSTARTTSATSSRSTWTRSTRSSANSRLIRPASMTASTSMRSSTGATRAAMSMRTEATPAQTGRAGSRITAIVIRSRGRVPQQAPFRVSATAQPPHRQDACPSGARVREHRADGRQVDPYHRTGRANFAMTMMAACYNLKRLVYFQKAGIKAF
ncbi:Transposase domain [Pseudomonas putida]|nr:Transposase domain [Pseudomonas putida]